MSVPVILLQSDGDTTFLNGGVQIADTKKCLG
jgi:hypothetical protein